VRTGVVGMCGHEGERAAGCERKVTAKILMVVTFRVVLNNDQIQEKNDDQIQEENDDQIQEKNNEQIQEENDDQIQEENDDQIQE
jgi:hypothetical protein